MGIKGIAAIVLIALTVVSCSKEETPVDDGQTVFRFSDSFETTSGDVNDLLPADGSRWTDIQQVDPETGTNALTLVQSPVSDGDWAISFLSNESGATLSKMDIEKGGFSAGRGESIRIEADFYINSTVPIEELFLIDLESCSCWDPSVPDNQCPGVRLKLGGGGEYLSMERGKILKETFAQGDVTFPLQQWVRVVWEMTLSTSGDGVNKVWLDGTLIIDETGINMPSPSIFEAEFAQYDIDFQMQEPVVYERVQIGATANPLGPTVEVLVDNFSLAIN